MIQYIGIENKSLNFRSYWIKNQNFILLIKILAMEEYFVSI